MIDKFLMGVGRKLLMFFKVLPHYISAETEKSHLKLMEVTALNYEAYYSAG